MPANARCLSRHQSWSESAAYSPNIPDQGISPCCLYNILDACLPLRPLTVLDKQATMTSLARARCFPPQTAPLTMTLISQLQLNALHAQSAFVRVCAHTHMHPKITHTKRSSLRKSLRNSIFLRLRRSCFLIIVNRRASASDAEDSIPEMPPRNVMTARVRTRLPPS